MNEFSKSLLFYVFCTDLRKGILSIGAVLKNKEEWRKYCSSGRRPINIPSSPTRTYRDSWNGWGDWLGTENKSFYLIEAVSSEEVSNNV